MVVDLVLGAARLLGLGPSDHCGPAPDVLPGDVQDEVGPFEVERVVEGRVDIFDLVVFEEPDELRRGGWSRCQGAVRASGGLLVRIGRGHRATKGGLASEVRSSGRVARHSAEGTVGTDLSRQHGTRDVIDRGAHPIVRTKHCRHATMCDPAAFMIR